MVLARPGMQLRAMFVLVVLQQIGSVLMYVAHHITNGHMDARIKDITCNHVGIQRPWDHQNHDDAWSYGVVQVQAAAKGHV